MISNSQGTDYHGLHIRGMDLTIRVHKAVTDSACSLQPVWFAGVAVTLGVMRAAEVGKATANFFSGLFGRNRPTA